MESTDNTEATANITTEEEKVAQVQTQEQTATTEGTPVEVKEQKKQNTKHDKEKKKQERLAAR